MKKNNISGSYEKFRENIFIIIKKTTVDIAKSEERTKKFNESILNEIFFEEYTPIEEHSSDQDKFFSTVAHGFKEINISFDRLQDLEVYISNYPKLENLIAKINFLRFLIENHLHEIYILKERLKKYSRDIMKFYINTNKGTSIKNACKLLYDIVEDNLKNIITVRNEHIHKARFSDKDIDRLVTIIIYQDFFDMYKKHLPPYYIIPNFQNEHKKLRKKWKKIFVNNNEQIKILLNHYFDLMIKIVFNNNGELLYPKKDS